MRPRETQNTKIESLKFCVEFYVEFNTAKFGYQIMIIFNRISCRELLQNYKAKLMDLYQVTPLGQVLSQICFLLDKYNQRFQDIRELFSFHPSSPHYTRMSELKVLGLILAIRDDMELRDKIYLELFSVIILSLIFHKSVSLPPRVHNRFQIEVEI